MNIKSLIKAFSNLNEITAGVINTLFKKENVELIAKTRMDICKSCDVFDGEGDKCFAPGTQPCCGDCGCSLGFKTRSLSSECPKGYWNSLVSEETEELITKQINIKNNEDIL